MPKKRRRTSGRSRRREGGAAEVRPWFERILVNARRAVDLASRLSVQDLHESNDLFWALAKYTENVQESITQLDNLNQRLLPCLVEIPVRPEIEGTATWADLKGMRNRLTHQFWCIDPKILWETVKEDLPKVIDLLSTLSIHPEPVGKGQPLQFTLRGQDLLSLPLLDGRSGPAPGQALVRLWFDEEGKPEAFRVGRMGDRRLALASSAPVHLQGLYRIEHGPEGAKRTQVGPPVDVG